ncbi:TATA-box-binding protein [Marine Group I thaumarchaeote SCGC RSA3]|uniref:TATA-box-binding protein n=2 Tax=Marine Group I TaxID=905826 RepID=A0A087RQL3_9ARCH|nr:TATA-box-binding protein [Marine Group I thaumarchaeote SCGC RSA3]
MALSVPIIDIVNVIASAKFENTIDLEKTIERIPQTEYNPSKFPGLVLRLSFPKASVLIFESGKMICTGTKSKEQSIRAINSVMSRLAIHGIDLGEKEPEIEVQNMVASVNLKGVINLEKCARILPKSMYEPEQFPALIYRSDSPAVMLVFGSGKLVCTGNKTEEDIFRAVASLHCILEEKWLISYN